MHLTRMYIEGNLDLLNQNLATSSSESMTKNIENMISLRNCTCASNKMYIEGNHIPLYQNVAISNPELRTIKRI